MKIAILIWELNIKGGTQRQALELALSLQKKGNEVDVYCYTYEKEKCYTELCNQLAIYAVDTSEQKKSHTESSKTDIKRFLYNIKVYIVLIKSIFSVSKPIRKLCDLLEATHKASYYDVINIHDYEVYKAARILSHSNIVWMMNDMQRAKGGEKSVFSISEIINKILLKLELRNIREIAVLDERNKEMCKKHYARDARVVRSGIDLNMCANYKLQRTFVKQHYSIFASSIFFPHRRFEDLVDAVEILVKSGRTNFSVTINGLNTRSYDYYVYIRDRIQDKNLTSYISIVNGMSESDLIKKYCESDIFVFPNTGQTWGLAVFEAMLAGCACIVSRGSGAHEVLSDRENALLVNQQSPQEIADGIEFLLQNPDQMKNISEHGVDFVKGRLSWDQYASEMVKIFAMHD